MPDSSMSATGPPGSAGTVAPWAAADTERCGAASAASTGCRCTGCRRSAWSGVRSATWSSSRRGCRRRRCSGCTTSPGISRAVSTGRNRRGRRRWCCSAPGPPAGSRRSPGCVVRPVACWRSAAATAYFLAAARAAGYDVRGVELSRTGAEHARTGLGLDVLLRPAGRRARRAGGHRLFLGHAGTRARPAAVPAGGRSAARSGRSVRLVDSVLLLGPGPALAVQVVDVEAGAAHLAPDAGHPTAGRGAGGAGDHLGDHLAAAAGERRTNRFAGRAGPGDTAGASYVAIEQARRWMPAGGSA